MQKLNKILYTPRWLFIVLIVVLVFRIPTFFEPYSYGDETIYLTLGQGMRSGLTLYKDIYDNKPPLLYATAALAGSLFWFKAILAIWMIITIYVFWKLTVVLFPKDGRLQKVATILFALFTTIPLFEGTIANAELFMIGPTIAAFFILFSKEHTYKNIFLAGTLFSIASLFKIPAAFDAPAIVFFWIITTKFTKGNLLKIVNKTSALTLGFVIPILITFVWYWGKGAFQEYLMAAYLQNFGYLSSWRPDSVQEPFLTKNGPLLIRGGVVILGFFILFLLRKKLSKQFIFITIWLLLSLFAVTLSERPYPHYLVQTVPSMALLFGMLFTLQTLEQSLVLIPLSLAFFVPVYFKFWYYQTLPYYTRFIQYASNSMSREEYMKSFGGGVDNTYKISKFITSSTRPTDPIFVWGADSSNVYALTRRLPPIKYVATYHINDFSNQDEVLNQLSERAPELIVILPDSQPFPNLLLLLQDRYGLAETIGGSQIWKLLVRK